MFRWWRTGLGAAFAVAVCSISTCQQRSGEHTPEAERPPAASVTPAPQVSPDMPPAALPAPAPPAPAPSAPAAPPAVPAPAQQPNSAPAPVVPLGPNAKTEDERNSISVFE